jgi:hypothetical protein
MEFHRLVFINGTRSLPQYKEYFFVISFQNFEFTMNYNKKIDFVIPCHPKDFASLRLAFKGIKNNISCCNNIYVISEENPDFENGIFISDNQFDQYITKDKIEDIWIKKNKNLAYRSNWLYQQFLKLFSAKVIESLTNSFVIVDSDTIFLRDIDFESDLFSFCKAEEYHKTYLEPIKVLLNTKKTIGYSCISHHMIFNKEIINQLISEIENRFNLNFVDAILKVIDYKEASCFSEWDLYANYILLNNPEMCKHRQLKWMDISKIPSKFELKIFKIIYDFVSCHAYRRGIE